jgi:membrane-associated phospholipid phosphatase
MDARRVFYLVDKVPELPYFIVAVCLILVDPARDYLHFFSASFVFMAAALAIGISIKVCFKSKRPKVYNSKLILFRYGFPSLHTTISVGALALVYFISPWLSLILLPVGLLYIHARLSGGYHTKSDVLGGIFLGLFLGALVGYSMDRIHFPERIEQIFAVLFFVIPAVCSFARIKEWV